MDRRLQLQLVLSAVDKVTGPLKRASQSSSRAAEALRSTRQQLRQVDNAARDLRSLREVNAHLRANRSRLEQSRASQAAHTEALKKQQVAHQGIQSALQNARRHHNRLAKALVSGKGESEEFRREYEKATISLRNQEQAHSKSSQTLKRYRDRTKNTRTQVEQLTRRQQQLTARLDPLRQRLQAAGVNTDQMGQSARRLRADSDALKTSLTQQKNRLDQLTASQERYQNRVAKMRGLHRAGMSVAAHGAGAMMMGRAAGQRMVDLIAPGISYGQQMSELQAVARLNRDDPRFTMLRDQARELGGSTAFSATEVGAGQTFLARAGFTPEAIRASMRDMLDLALANGTDLARTADIASNISSAFKIDPETEGNMQRVADVLSGTASRANVDLEMLGETMKYLGQAEGLDVSLEQAATFAGLLGNIGIQGSQAGTTLRAMLSRLSAPRGEARKAMDALGLRVDDESGNMRDIMAILDDVSWATEKMGNVERSSYLKRIFGDEAGSGMAELIRQQGSGGVSELLKQLQNVQGENSAMAAVRADNLGGDLKSLRSAWEEVGITVSDVNNGPLRDFIQSLTETVRGISAWVKENPELAARLAKIAAGVTLVLLVLGPLAIVLGTSMMALSGFGRVLLAIPATLRLLSKALIITGKALLWIGRILLMNPIGLLVTAIAGGAYLIWRDWEPLSEWFSGLWTTISIGIQSFWAGLKQAWQGGWSGMTEWTLDGLAAIGKVILDWSPIGLFYKAFAGVLRYFEFDLPASFTEFGAELINGLVSGIVSKFGDVKKAVSDIADSTIGWFKEKLGINSPSRVFASFGHDTLAGYQQGLDRNTRQTLNQVDTLTKRITAAGAGVALTGALAMPVAADMQWDTRPPISRTQPAPTATGERIEIHIHAAPGMSEMAIAQQVERLLDERERQRAARSRSALYDR
ncbi:phage tail tape measure protein [Marinimicrobium sp. ARAG 43.8]|uniref:phage tail tape measure protein n=1 Tax=Marinimicrobium sp. ARAG 43.8 TaxID=3418719 RepID=UPI003CFA20E9